MMLRFFLRPYVWLYFIGSFLILYYGYHWINPIVQAHSIQQIPKPKIKLPIEKKEITAYDLYPKKIKVGENIGILRIPKIREILQIIHGASENELEKGVGHYEKSVLPGLPDMTVLVGHRDTVFRRLGELRIGDIIIVETMAGTFTYKIKEIKIVDQNDRSVIHSTYPKPKLLLSTCYPFNYLGPAPKRYVLIADLVKQQLNI